MVTPHRMRTALLALALAASAAGCGASAGRDDAGPTTTSKTPAADRPESTGPVDPTDPPETTDPDDWGRGDVIPEEPEAPASEPTTDFVTVSDPVNNAFSVGVPQGWDSLVYSSVEGQITREVVNTVSPDGETILFIGDPKIPTYYDPAVATPIVVEFCDKLDFMELRSYEPATEYVPAYVERKFGGLPGFELVDWASDPEAEAGLAQAIIERGMTPPELGIVNVDFRYETDAGEPVKGKVTGTSMNLGASWFVNVMGLATTGDEVAFREMLRAMTHTQQSNPDWTAMQNARHEQVMAQIDANTQAMTSAHQARMAAIQSSAQRHQQRMEGIWAANDASMANYYDRMNAGDASQRSFLNYINEENTVSGTSGQTWQVDSGYDRYWMNPTTGSYVGGDINFGESSLQELGLNPGDYEEVQIVR